MQRLPNRLQTPVLLHYYAGLSLEDISARLRLPLGITQRRLEEGRGLLRQMVEASSP